MRDDASDIDATAELIKFGERQMPVQVNESVGELTVNMSRSLNNRELDSVMLFDADVLRRERESREREARWEEFNTKAEGKRDDRTFAKSR